MVAALRWLDDAEGSDLHLTADRRPMARLNGELRPVPDAGVWSASVVEAALRSLMTAERWAAFERDREADFPIDLPGAAEPASRFRVNVSRQRGGVCAAFRRIPGRIRDLRELGLPEGLGNLADLPRGLVLVTGRAGAGKSTTLAAMVDRINRTRAAHVVTIEDPVEFVHTEQRALIHQREVGADTGDFPTALRSALRQDPDVLLLGELRDLETISGALTAAETGHLVLATLHTQGAAQTIDRIVDVFPAHRQNQVRAQLALTLKAVVSQELLRRADGRGRVVAAEVMITTPAISNLIRDERHHQIPNVMMSGGDAGMRTMDQALAGLVLDGTLEYDTAVHVAHDRALLADMVGSSRAAWSAQPAGAELSRTA